MCCAFAIGLPCVVRVQEEKEELKRKEQQTEKHMLEVAAENKGLKEPLRVAQETVADLQTKLANYEKVSESR